jgi:UPF0716 protein FxsA
MRAFLVLLLLFPVLELYVFFKAGQAIGFFPALLLIIAGSALGVLVLRVAGLTTALRARASLQSGELPAEDMLSGAMVAVGGLLLIIPGFISDLMALFFLLPVTRRVIAGKLRDRTQASVMRQRPFTEAGPGISPQPPRRPNVIEGEYEHRDS